MKANIVEDIGSGKIITKIEFFKGPDIVKTETVNAQKINREVEFTGEKVLVVSKDNESPNGAYIGFQRGASDTAWTMSNSTSPHWPLGSVTPEKTPGTNLDAYPGSKIKHRVDFNRIEAYKSDLYPDIPNFKTKVLDTRSQVLDPLNETKLTGADANVKVLPNRCDIVYPLGMGQTDDSTEVVKLEVTTVDHAYIFFTQNYDHEAYFHKLPAGNAAMMYYLAAYSSVYPF
ncbi:hypothetical protein EJP82_11205 [Paenibacillus anaericanus]|uniref:Uncharacterized protein n=1 Tax=Paenibacillus anaericanus TaxID=170367 RepID=A0A3S1DKJ5_9BACL|nr:hypothetical protein [Paenibacillus anaericanus]RUT46788.1 hypothetical protein EJP82_11205 [Paenibacillus anaericanus]